MTKKLITMKTQVIFAAIALAGISFQACNSAGKKDSAKQAEEINEQKDSLNSEVSEFAVNAASGGMMEVELGNYAAQNAGHARVKHFGEMMVRDHTKANDELKSLASTKNITLPATLSEKHQKHVDDLKKLKGAEFDKEYMDLMVKDHKEDIDEFEEASRKEADAEIKAFAGKTLPVLKMHLDSAKAIDEALKNSKKP